MTIYYSACALLARYLRLHTNTHSEYAIPTAFPVQQWLHECALMLRYTYIAFLFYGEKEEACLIVKPSDCITHFKFSKSSEIFEDLGVNHILPDNTPKM